MYIRCWGARGSIPVSGKHYLKYGGDTTCVEIRAKSGHVVVIDAGTGIRPLGHKLAADKKVREIELLFTHAHIDHVMGFGFFQPNYMKGMRITIRGYPYELRSYKEILGGILRSPYFPIELADKDFRAKFSYRKITDRPFSIGSLTFIPIPLSHPKDGGTGFRIEEDGKVFVFLTDNELEVQHNGGLTFEDYVRYSKGADLLIHDAEYKKNDYKPHRGWGHSLYTDAIQLGLKAQVKQLGFYHHNNRRTDTEIDAMVTDSRKIIARAKSKMRVFGVTAEYEVTL